MQVFPLFSVCTLYLQNLEVSNNGSVGTERVIERERAVRRIKTE